MRAAVVQLNSGDEKGRNLEVAERLVRAAAEDGAELVVLPEKWNLLAAPEVQLAGAEPLDGPSLAAAADWARELGIHLVAGSIAERVEGDEKIRNTSALIDPEGNVAAIYRKIHMFDVDVGGVSYRESGHESPGTETVIAPLGDVEIGLTVCYDLRFPELYRLLAVEGARLISVPAAFTSITGKAHWEVLLRARAIENQVFMVAADQVGETPPNYDSHGHSMIVDPWGRVLACAEGGEGFAAADLDPAEQDRIRADLPSLANRQPDAYRLTERAGA